MGQEAKNSEPTTKEVRTRACPDLSPRGSWPVEDFEAHILKTYQYTDLPIKEYTLLGTLLNVL